MTSITDSIQINATPEAVFAAVSHLELMGQFSPENTGGQWRNGATGPALGAKFRGTNSNGKVNWSTTVKVVSYEPSSDFAFEVTAATIKVARWSFHIEENETGVVV